MDAVSALNEHLDVERILHYYDFERIRHDGRMIRSCCKLHGGNNPSGFVIDSETGLFYCHTGDCGGGDIYTMVQKLENVPFKVAVAKVASILKVNIEYKEIKERQASYVNELKKWLKTMQSRKKKNPQEYHIKEEIRKVMKFRDFQMETIEHFGLGFVAKIQLWNKDNKPYHLYNRLVFPIIREGVQIGASLRRTKTTDKPKWSHQPANLETNELLYNYDATMNEPSIVIVEGAVDVWAYYEIGVVAVATFGAHLTEEQYRLLMRTGADLVWSYDGDDAGRNATRKALEQFRYKANQYVVEFKETEDPASIPREELRRRYEQRERRIN